MAHGNWRLLLRTILWDQLWIHYAKQRLPRFTLDSWEQHRNRNGNTELPTLKNFIEFLDVKAKGRREFELESEMINLTSTSHQKSSVEHGRNRFKPYDKRDKGNKNKKTEPRSGGPTRCIMPGCSQVHYLGQCELFRKLTLQERLELTRKQQLCRCCLLKGHMAISCSRDGCSKCPEDRFKHHFRLCPKTVGYNKANNNIKEPPKEQSRQ